MPRKSGFNWDFEYLAHAAAEALREATDKRRTARQREAAAARFERINAHVNGPLQGLMMRGAVEAE